MTVSQAREILPASVCPVHYAVSLTPDLTSFSFGGVADIELKVLAKTSQIVCNATELDIQSVRITSVNMKTEQALVASKIEFNTQLEQVTFTFPSSFDVDSKVSLHVEFTGTLNDRMAGFYRSSYSDAHGNKKFMASTQFEATDARKAFPCWDEPALKATFDITLNVDSNLTALSNMNVVDEKTIQVNGKALKAVKFAKTPIMSTYLVAMVVGELEYLETTANPTSPAGAKPIVVRTYTPPGLKEQSRFALNVAARVLEFFSSYFNIAYPLPKLDQVAITEFSAGAMENWGLVTYRTVYLLFDEKNSAAKAKERVAYVVAHELAHQWFGNLVTMEFWDDLWLNEAFATFVGWLAVDKLYPEWNIWTQFIMDDFSRGLSLDGLKASHPIQVEVKSPSEITQIFDAISYCKGASVIRMLANSLSLEKFMDGVRIYLKKFTYSNAMTSDLWDALAISSGVDVQKLMHPWTKEMGYPVVEILGETFDAAKKELSIKLRQRRFLNGGGLTAEEDKTVWWVPLSVVTHQSKTPIQHILSTKESTITIPYEQTEKSFFAINAETNGFFRVKYDSKHLIRLGKSISALTMSDRLGLLMDAFALAAAGDASTTGALDLLKAMTAEEEYIVLSEMASRLGTLQSTFYKESKEVTVGLKTLAKSIFATKVASVGFDYPAGEDHMKGLKRTLVLSQAGKAGDEGVITEIKKRFDKFIAGDESALHPNLRGVAFNLVLRTATPSTADPVYNQIHSIYKTSVIADQKLAALGALGVCPFEAQIQRTLALALNTEEVRSQDIMYPLSALVKENPNTSHTRAILFPWVKANWKALHERYHSSLSLLGRCFQISVEDLVGEEDISVVQAWVDCKGIDDGEKEMRLKEIKGISRSIQQSLEKVKASTAWVRRDVTAIEAWVKDLKA